MNQLYHIYAGMKGGEVSNRINENMTTIKSEIERLENLIKALQPQDPTPEEPTEEVLQAINIMASPESNVIASSPMIQTIEIPITIYYGNTKLNYNLYDDGISSYSLNLGSTNIYDNNILLATVGGRRVNSQLVLVVNIQPNIEANFSYVFGITFMGVTYQKLIAFNVIASEAKSALSVELSPSSVIINESYSGSTLELANAYCNYTVHLGDKDVTQYVNCSIPIGSCLNCQGEIVDTTVYISSVDTVYGEGKGRKLFQWTNIDGQQHSEYKVTDGYVSLLFSYVKDGTLYQCIKKFNFTVNYLGTFRESIVNDIHSQVSKKVVTTLTDDGLLLTESAKTEIYQSAEKIALSAVSSGTSGMQQSYLDITESRIQSIVEDVNGNISKIEQNANEIRMGLSGAGISISAGTITLDSDNTIVKNLTATGLRIVYSGDTSSSSGTPRNKLVINDDGSITQYYPNGQPIKEERWMFDERNSITGITITYYNLYGVPIWQLGSEGYKNKEEIGNYWATEMLCFIEVSEIPKTINAKVVIDAFSGESISVNTIQRLSPTGYLSQYHSTSSGDTSGNTNYNLRWFIGIKSGQDEPNDNDLFTGYIANLSAITDITTMEGKTTRQIRVINQGNEEGSLDIEIQTNYTIKPRRT